MSLTTRLLKRLCTEIDSNPDENAMSYVINTLESYIRHRLRPSVYIILFLIFTSIILQASTLFYLFRLIPVKT